MPHVWTIVLAAGAGRRLAPVTSGVPKQFWCGPGGRSLLDETLARFAPVSDRLHTVVIADQSHRAMLERSVEPFGTAVYQPADRGTAAGVLLSITPVLARDPDAIVVVTPSDHGVADRARFLSGIREMVGVVEAQDHIVLSGVESTASCDDYGWILPARTTAAGVVQPVASFVEKPPLAAAQRLLQRGGVWNTMVVAARAGTLRDLCVTFLPELEHVATAAALPPAERDRALDDVYRQLKTADFSRDVLAKAPDLLCHVWPKALGWTDLGTPERLLAWLNRGPAAQPLQGVA